MKEQIFVSAVVYARNAEATVGPFLRSLDAQLREHFQTYELIVVNDTSLDQTLQRARKTAAEIPGAVTLLNLPYRHGVEGAMLAGLDRSVGDFVFEFDSTVMDFPPELIHHLYQIASMEGSDIVAATPTGGRGSLGSILFYWLVNQVSYLRLDLASERFRLVTRRALNAMLNMREKVRYRKALYAVVGYEGTRVHYAPVPGAPQQSRKWNAENVGLALDVILSFSDIGPRLSTYFAGAFLLFSLGASGWAVGNYFYKDNVVEGWTTLMILLSFGFAGLFFIVGLIGQYIIRILIEVQNRPSYTVAGAEIYKSPSGHHVPEPHEAQAGGKR